MMVMSYGRENMAGIKRNDGEIADHSGRVIKHGLSCSWQKIDGEVIDMDGMVASMSVGSTNGISAARYGNGTTLQFGSVRGVDRISNRDHMDTQK